ncbi:hypothetical protein BOX15_Mlig031761g3 [Macrostomum lignano]|uniref:Tudor domain-containing protein n=2 Tax=Macrostomum lignano TaxID=282301 RepID=A0A267H0E5_9PLAT|nr:hypothetical protein BOX15_Mlig031761g3 [Macrostomum lignano]
MNQMKPSLQRCLPSENLMDTDPTGWYALPLPANCDILASLTELKHRLDKLSVRQECDGALGQAAFNYLAKDLKSLTANSDKSRRPIVRCCLLSDLSPYGIFTACQASPVRFELISHIQSDLQLRRAVEPGFRTVVEACSVKATSPLALRPDQRVYAMSRDGTWGRGRVLSESSASVSVRFFDLGKTENISRDRIVDAESDTRYSAVPELSFECCLAEPAQQAVLKDPNWFANRIGGQDGRAFLLRSAGECRFRSRRVLRVEAWPDNDAETDHAVVDEDFAAKLAADFSDLLTGAVKETVSSHAASHHRDIRLQENPDLPCQVYTFSATTTAAPSSTPSVALNAISPFEEEFAPLIRQGMLRPIADDEAGMLNGGRAVDSDAEGLDYAEDDEDNDQVVVLVDRNAVRAASLPGSQVTSPTSSSVSVQQQQQQQQQLLQQQHQLQLYSQQMSLPMQLQHQLHHQTHPPPPPPQSMMLPPPIPQVSQSMPLQYGHHQHPPPHHHPHHPHHHHAMSHAPPMSDYAQSDYSHSGLYAAPHHHPQRQQQHHPQHPMQLDLSSMISPHFLPTPGQPPPPQHLVYSQPPPQMPPPTGYHHGPHPSQQPPVTMSMQPMHHPVIVPVSDCIAAGAIVNGGSSTNGRNNGAGGSSTSPYYYSEPRPEVECPGNSAELHDDEVPDNGERNEEEKEEKEEEEECGHNAEEDAEEYDVGDEQDERDGDYDDQEAEEADEDFHEAEESPFDSLSGDERRWTSRSANWEDVVAADEKAKADSAAAAEALKKTERSSDGASPQTTPKLASPAPPAATSSRFNGWQYNVLKNTLQKRATSPDTTAAAAADASTRHVQPATGQQPRQQSPMTGDSRGGGAGLRQPRRDERGGGGFRGGGDRGPGTKRSGGGKQQRNIDRPASGVGGGNSKRVSGPSSAVGVPPVVFGRAAAPTAPRLMGTGGGRLPPAKGLAPVDKPHQPQQQQQQQQQQQNSCGNCGLPTSHCRCQMASGRGQRTGGGGGKKSGRPKSGRGQNRSDRRPSNSDIKRSGGNLAPVQSPSASNLVTDEWES